MDSPAPLIVWTTAIGTDDGGTLTAVNRVWNEKDAERCRLCDICVRVPVTEPCGDFMMSACTVATTSYVDPDSAAGFSLRG